MSNRITLGCNDLLSVDVCAVTHDSITTPDDKEWWDDVDALTEVHDLSSNIHSPLLKRWQCCAGRNTGVVEVVKLPHNVDFMLLHPNIVGGLESDVMLA